MSEMSKIHIWIGTTGQTEEEFKRYFEIDYSTGGDFDDPLYKTCQFCLDIGEKWYDEDFLGIMPIYEEPVDVKELLDLTPIGAPFSYQEAYQKSIEAGIFQANAIFYYANCNLILTEIKPDYNGLKYLGFYYSCLI